MNDLYPSMMVPYSRPSISIAEIYIYGSVVLGILAILTLALIKEPKRYYRIMKRKNTDESPIIQV
jgi:hypothetical protein